MKTQTKKAKNRQGLKIAKLLKFWKSIGKSKKHAEIIIPRYGSATMLLLEFLRVYNDIKIENIQFCEGGEFFGILLSNIKNVEEAGYVIDYINTNLFDEN